MQEASHSDGTHDYMVWVIMESECSYLNMHYEPLCRIECGMKGKNDNSLM